MSCNAQKLSRKQRLSLIVAENRAFMDAENARLAKESEEFFQECRSASIGQLLKLNAQAQFLLLSESKDARWPTVTIGRDRCSLSDLAIHEGILAYLVSGSMDVLRDFLESATCRLRLQVKSTDVSAFLCIGSEAVSKFRAVAKDLIEVYGFLDQPELAWHHCSEGPFDCDCCYYLLFGRRTQAAVFRARHALAFLGSSPLTEVGLVQAPEVFELVDADLDEFQVREGKNLFEFYLDYAHKIAQSCRKLPKFKEYSSGKIKTLPELLEVRNQIVQQFIHCAVSRSYPLQSKVEELFTNIVARWPTAQIASDLDYEPRPYSFLARHFEVVARCEYKGLSFSMERQYANGKHQTAVPHLPSDVSSLMRDHITDLFRKCESRIRNRLCLKGVGRDWSREAAIYVMLKKQFPNETIIQHARPKWLGNQ